MSTHLKYVHAVELSDGARERVAPLFDVLSHHLSVRGTLSGTVPGRVFSAPDGDAAVLVNEEGIFACGNAGKAAFFAEMNAMLASEAMPARTAMGKRDYVVFYPQGPEFAPALEALLADLHSMSGARMSFGRTVEHAPPSLPEGTRAVDEALLCSGMPGTEGVLEEISGMWGSASAFAEGGGLGCVAVRGGEIAGWCLSDWIVGDACELGIETYAPYRRLGLARDMALGALSLARARGILRAGWQCWCDNEASRATALSAGFTLRVAERTRFGWMNPLDNWLVNGNVYLRGDAFLGEAPDYARSAHAYAQALDRGHDWGGHAQLYWNAACMFYKSGEPERAREYYKAALARGFKGHAAHAGDPYVYGGEDAVEIARALLRG